MHNPNPFDFVPFAANPTLKTPAELDGLGAPLSGYFTFRLCALTPIHVVGCQRRDDKRVLSYLYRQRDLPCVPAASIRGCIRAFLEALTSGWVSQANPEYEREYRHRHIGFSTFAAPDAAPRPGRRPTPGNLPWTFKPVARDDGQIDVASFLLGTVTEPAGRGERSGQILARKSRVWIEDAFFPSTVVNQDDYWVPDILGQDEGQDSFMGGGKPSASSWWYLQPSGYRLRRVVIVDRRTGASTHTQVMEFLGGSFRGRKFYYHQNPLACVDYYSPSKGQWKYSARHEFVEVALQCIDAKKQSDEFRVYLDRVPRPLAALLLLAFLPGQHIRHKLGYGKAYGYGSVEFALTEALLRMDDSDLALPAPLESCKSSVESWAAAAWNHDKIQALGLDTALIDFAALEHLARILTWQPNEKLLFTYPGFTPRGNDFAKVIVPAEFGSKTGILPPILGQEQAVTDAQARQIATKLYGLKEPLEFRHYQETAEGWSIIAGRTP